MWFELSQLGQASATVTVTFLLFFKLVSTILSPQRLPGNHDECLGTDWRRCLGLTLASGITVAAVIDSGNEIRVFVEITTGTSDTILGVEGS